MGFIAPVSFWFLSAIPILLVFYFFKKQYDQQTISSIYLWERTLQEWESDHWWNKLQKNILLFLQLLILLFLIAALTRPFIVGEEVGGDQLVIILDSSATMLAEQDGTSRFDREKIQAKQLIDQLGDGQKVSIIHAQKAPVLLTTDQTDKSELVDQIDQLEISYQHENLNDSIELAQSLIQQETGEIHIFTDSLPEERLKEVNLTKPITVHNIRASQENTAILTFGVKEIANQVTAIVTLKNESNHAMDVILSIKNEGNIIKELAESIPAEEERTITINDLPIHDYYHVQIGADDYKLDNEMYALLPQQQSPTIYLAGGVNPFIESALLSAGMKVTTVPQDEDGNYAFKEHEPESIYLLSGVDASQWPTGPKLIISPIDGGPFDVNGKIELQYALEQVTDDTILNYSGVNTVYLGKAYQIGNWNGLRPLVKSNEHVTVAKGIYESAPMILFAFDLSDSDWVLQPGFPILLANSIAYLTEAGSSLGYYLPLETATFNLSTLTEEAIIESLDGNNISEIGLSESEVSVPSQPGIYQLHEKSTNGSSIRYLVVQLENEERTAISAESFSVDVEGLKENSTTSITKQEFWRIFAGIALLLLFIEWEVYRRGISSR